MTIKTIKLSDIISPAHNPRKVFDDATIQGLADSIKHDGLLQNLVVAPSKGRKYRIISGERRLRAMLLLLERGDINSDYEVTVEIRKNLSKHDQLRIATVENVQREKLPPMDEAEAFTALAQKGATLEELAAQTGFTVKTIKRRLSLSDLCEEAKHCLREESITLAVAEALTVGSHEAQKPIIEHIKKGFRYDAESVRNDLLRNKTTIAMAIFPIEEYQGTFSHDLFAEEDSTYFDDEEQFLTLQQEAVTKLEKQHLDNGALFVDLSDDYSLTEWHYEKVKEGQESGVAINISPYGEVTVLENIIKHEIDPETEEETKTEKKPKAFYSVPVCRNMALHKSMAVQAELMKHPKLCKIIATLKLLNNKKVHGCLLELAKANIKPKAYTIINELAKDVSDLLPSLTKTNDEYWVNLKYYLSDDRELFNDLYALEDEKLDQLHSLLTVLEFGQKYCDKLDTDSTSVFNRVGQIMEVDMVQYWRPDEEFLKRRNKGQLLDIAKDCGANTKMGMIQDYKKSDLVKNLEGTFKQVSEQDSFSEDEANINTWLPEAMRFPAVDVTQEQDKEVA